MGNSSCTSQPPHSQQTDLLIEQHKSNGNLYSDYKHPRGVKSQNTQNSGVPKFKCLLDVKGSKSLNFGLQSKEKQASRQPIKRKTEQIKETYANSQGKTHLQPIVFSIIDFDLPSQPQNQPQSKQNFDSTQRFNKHLSSTCDEDDHHTSINQVTNDYILSYVPNSPHIDINKQQFIRIKKQNIQHQYAFLSKLGQGAFGEVYRCENIRTKQQRAIKLLKKSILLNPKVKQQFLQEFNLLKKIDHPNIIKIYEIYQMSQSMCIVTQLCSGNSLASYLKEKVKFTYETKREILRQLFLGVNYLHHTNITHRDLKPDNIVFINQLTERTAPNEVDLRIIDLGLAIEEKQKVFKDWINIGTYNYMSPEAFTGIYSSKCDAWACGVIMFTLLLDINPFKGFDLDEVKSNIHKFSALSVDFKDLPLNAKNLMLNLIKSNYVLRWGMDEALASDYFHTDSSACRKTHIFDKLSSYNQGNGLVSATESYLALKKTNQSHQLQLAKYFHSINSNKNGLILENQFKHFFSGVPVDQVQLFFKKLDKNRSGSVDFGEFLVGMTNRRDLFTQANLREVFDFIDVNKNGQISKEQLKYFLRALEKAPINELIDEIGRNDKNGVTFDQFKSYLLKERWL